MLMSILKTLLVTYFDRSCRNYGTWLFPVNRYTVTMVVMSRQDLPTYMRIAGVEFQGISVITNPDPEHHHDLLYYTELRQIGTSKKKYDRRKFQYAEVESLDYEVVSL